MNIENHRVINQTIAEVRGVDFDENKTFSFIFEDYCDKPRANIAFGYFSNESYSKIKPMLYNDTISTSFKIELMKNKSVFPLCESGLIRKVIDVKCELALTKKGKLIFLSKDSEPVSFSLTVMDFYFEDKKYNSFCICVAMCMTLGPISMTILGYCIYRSFIYCCCYGIILEEKLEDELAKKELDYSQILAQDQI